jgi:hypothetical protein
VSIFFTVRVCLTGWTSVPPVRTVVLRSVMNEPFFILPLTAFFRAPYYIYTFFVMLFGAVQHFFVFSTKRCCCFFSPAYKVRYKTVIVYFFLLSFRVSSVIFLKWKPQALIELWYIYIYTLFWLFESVEKNNITIFSIIPIRRKKSLLYIFLLAFRSVIWYLYVWVLLILGIYNVLLLLLIERKTKYSFFTDKTVDIFTFEFY